MANKNVNNTKKPNKSTRNNSNKNNQKRTKNQNNKSTVKKTNSSRKVNKKNSTTKRVTSKKINNKNNNNKNIKIIPLGGLEQIGINITAFEYEDEILVVDCGLGFPSDDMLGIDLVIPDTTYLERNIDKVKAFVITHGHEDHIGAIPYVLSKVNVPIYATKLTMGLIDKKLEEKKLQKKIKKIVVSNGEKRKIGKFNVEFIKTNHSIQDACALAITTPVGCIIHTGDFKVDYTPVYGDSINLSRFAELGKKGVLALLSDSTNAIKPGFTKSEKSVGKAIDNIFSSNTKNRLIIATFASNVDRVQQIINSAKKYKRKVLVDGRSMLNIIEIARKLGYLKVNDKALIEANELQNYKDNQICIISTGSQGESMAALSRMANGTHKYVKISTNDTIVFSSSPIPGNEKAIYTIINDLSRLGANVIFEGLHVSGHACEEDLKLIYSLTKPKYAIPLHGEYRHLVANANIAKELGIPDKNIIVAKSGDVISVNSKKIEVTSHVETGTILVDGLGIGDIGNTVMKERHSLADGGVVVAVLTIDSNTKTLMLEPEIISKGFVYNKDSDALIEEMTYILKKHTEKLLSDSKEMNLGVLKSKITSYIRDFILKKIQRNPVIICSIVEV